MDIEKIYEMRCFAYSLMNGIDPTSKTSFPDDTTLNIPEIRQHNRDICELLDAILVSTAVDRERTSKQIPFFILKRDLEGFSYFEEPVSISMFCNRLNEYRLPGMAKIQVTTLTKGLTNMGFLENRSIDEEKMYKVPTDKGRKLQIQTVNKTNSYGNSYSVNLYPKEAQHFLLENLFEIIKASTMK